MNPSIQQQIAAYEKVLDLTERGVIDPSKQAGLESCVYDNSARAGKPNFCSVGALLTPAQIADIKRRRLNKDASVDTLASIIGRDNLEAATGLPMTSLRTMQQTHDGLSDWSISSDAAKRTFRSYIKGRIRRLSR